MNTDGTRQRRLTHDTAIYGRPIFSPDGRQIVYSSSDRSGQFEIGVMNADGSQQRQLTTGGGSYSEAQWGSS
jgi:Tol biopolymer transport system component